MAVAAAGLLMARNRRLRGLFQMPVEVLEKLDGISDYLQELEKELEAEEKAYDQKYRRSVASSPRRVTN